MKFDEQGFRHLVDETIATIIRLGTTSHAVLDRYERFTEMLVKHLKSLDQPFELTLCLEWVNSLDHDPACVLSASYVDWKALHRFVHLLAEQQAGTLTEWRHYLCFTPELPETDEYNVTQVLLDKNGNMIEDWLVGMSILRIPDGKYKGLYGTFVDEVGRGEGYGKFYQRIRIAKLDKPWQLGSDLYTVTTPTQDWEKKGCSSVLPMVVEGATAVYGDNGEICHRLLNLFLLFARQPGVCVAPGGPVFRGNVPDKGDMIPGLGNVLLRFGNQLVRVDLLGGFPFHRRNLKAQSRQEQSNQDMFHEFLPHSIYYSGFERIFQLL